MRMLFQIMLPDFVSILLPFNVYNWCWRYVSNTLTDFVSTVTGKDMNGIEKSRTWERSLVNVRSAAIISASYNNEDNIRTNLRRKSCIFHYQIDV